MKVFRVKDRQCHSGKLMWVGLRTDERWETENHQEESEIMFDKNGRINKYIR